MRVGALFWDWSARRVFSPNPHATVVFLAHSSSPDGHTNKENGSSGVLRGQLQGGEREKKRMHSLFDRARPL